MMKISLRVKQLRAQGRKQVSTIVRAPPTLPHLHRSSAGSAAGVRTHPFEWQKVRDLWHQTDLSSKHSPPSCDSTIPGKPLTFLGAPSSFASSV